MPLIHISLSGGSINPGESLLSRCEDLTLFFASGCLVVHPLILYREDFLLEDQPVLIHKRPALSQILTACRVPVIIPLLVLREGGHLLLDHEKLLVKR